MKSEYNDFLESNLNPSLESAPFIPMIIFYTLIAVSVIYLAFFY